GSSRRSGVFRGHRLGVKPNSFVVPPSGGEAPKPPEGGTTNRRTRSPYGRQESAPRPDPSPLLQGLRPRRRQNRPGFDARRWTLCDSAATAHRQSAGTTTAALHPEGQEGHLPVHGGRAEPAGTV